MFSSRYWTFIIIVIAAIGYSMLKPEQNTDILKSPADPYSYRYLTLENGVKTLLVSTPDTDKAAAAMSVRVGSGDNPADRAGLAHFLEHMLFLGTEDYPEPGEYQAFISRHGGSNNAFTAYRQTTYFFSIDNDAFEGALDRFAPFFISPKFDEAYVDREKNAVNAEYLAKIKDDFRRVYSGEKQAMNPEHPYSGFFVGSLKTLSDSEQASIRDDLINFYNQYYSSDRMTLVLAGNYPLDQLESWAQSHFDAIPKRDPVKSESFPPLFTADSLPLDMTIEPVKEIRRLRFTFPMPEVMSQYRYKPVSFLAGLIGHEGEGSVLAMLKEKGWAESLSAGTSVNSEYESALSIQIGLTKAGLEHKDRITDILMHYLERLRTEPIPDYLFEEQKQLNEMAFRFQEKGKISNYVVSLSSNLLQYPAEHVLNGAYLQEAIPDRVLEPYLNRLQSHNMLRTLVAPDVETSARDPWYGTPLDIQPSGYQKSALSAADTAQLHLPAPNPFIASDFDILQHPPQEMPGLILDKPGHQLWQYPEQEFQLPRAQILVRLSKPGMQTARQQVLARLFVRTANEALNTFSYPAQLAGLGYSLSTGTQGIQIMVSGYQDKQPELLEQILKQMQQIELSGDQLSRYKASLQRSLENQLKAKPYERGIAELKRWIYQPSFSESELLEQLDGISVADVKGFASELSAHSQSLMYVHGNLNSLQAIQMSELLQRFYPPQTVATESSGLRVLKAPQGKFQQDLALDHEDKGIVLYLQGSDTSDLSRARYALLGQILSSPYYEYMRTERQLGYIVFAAVYPQRAVPGLVFIVQSPTASPSELIDHTEGFWTEFKQTLDNMSEEEFSSFKSGLTSRLLEPPKNMGSKAERFWREIDLGRTGFDTNSAIAALVETLTLSDIQALYQGLLVDRTSAELLFSQGGDLEGWQSAADINRTELSHFDTSPAKGAAPLK